MGFLSVLSAAQRWVAERAAPGSVAIDATAGSGVDTLFLARTIGAGGHVYAFDVQEAAIARTRARLEAAGRAGEAPASGGRRGGSAGGGLAPVTLLLAGHERMAELVAPEHRGAVRAVMFNLGYLPGEGGDRRVITRPETTLAAMEAALGLMAPGGVLTAVVYPGHEGGDAEAEAVERWMAALPPTVAQAVQYRYPQKPASPYLLALEKR